MEILEKVELVREKTNVSYEKARAALEACDYDVLDAIIAIEREAVAEAAQAVEDILSEKPIVEDAPEVAEVVEPEPAAAQEVEPEVEAEAEPAAEEEPPVEPEPEYDVAEEYAAHRAAAQAKREATRKKYNAAWNNFVEKVKHFIDAGLKMMFIVERHGAQVCAIPVLFVIVGLFMWGSALWLMIIGLFFGFRYRVEGANPMTVDVNSVMSKAADVADDIKHDLV